MLTAAVVLPGTILWTAALFLGHLSLIGGEFRILGVGQASHRPYERARPAVFPVGRLPCIRDGAVSVLERMDESCSSVLPACGDDALPVIEKVSDSRIVTAVHDHLSFLQDCVPQDIGVYDTSVMDNGKPLRISIFVHVFPVPVVAFEKIMAESVVTETDKTVFPALIVQIGEKQYNLVSFCVAEIGESDEEHDERLERFKNLCRHVVNPEFIHILYLLLWFFTVKKTMTDYKKNK